MSRLLVQFHQLFKSFGPLSLFEDLSLSINAGEAFALIGENGSGKTTLLKLLTGEIEPDRARFNRAPHLTIGFLPQEVPALDLSARAYLEEGPCPLLEQQMAACLDHPERIAEWGALHEKYEQLGGYRRLPAEKILHGLKLEPSLLDLPMAALSSGQRIRIALAKSVMENPDLLLLDEPTNHLDNEMLAWLKEMLRARDGATVIISHDRKFLNETCNRLIELKNGKLTCYGGGYDYYLEEQKKLLARQIAAYEAQQEELAQLKQKIKTVTFNKEKPPKPKDRNIMAYDKRGELHQKSLQHKLDVMKARLEEIETNLLPHPKPKTIKGMRFPLTPLTSTFVIEIDQIAKSYGEKRILSHFTHLVYKGDRIIITGPNGSGKTTLLNCLAGQQKIDAGQIRFASSAKVAYLDQEMEHLPMEKTPLEYFRLSEEELMRELHKAALGGTELLRSPFAHMSVGQRKRLGLLSLILQKPNVLLLDEPTNHLDLLTLEAFETALLQFEGVIIAVSHDATFIKKLGAEEWKLQ